MPAKTAKGKTAKPRSAGKGLKTQGAPAKRKIGRPSSYTEAEGANICRMISSGKTLRQVEEETGRGWSCISKWIVSYPDFARRYNEARAASTDALETEIIDVARGSVDASKRLHVQTLQWVLARRSPQRYGDRMAFEHTGAGGGPIGVVVVPAKADPGSLIEGERVDD